MSRGRRDDVTNHARFMVGTQLNIAQFSTHYQTISGDSAACGLSSSSRRWLAEDRRHCGFCFLTPPPPRQKRTI